MAKKRYSVQARAAYHEKRMNDSKVSKKKRDYSRFWIDGYNNKYARDNYAAVNQEIRMKKGRMSSTDRVILYGWRNGMKAQLESKK